MILMFGDRYIVGVVLEGEDEAKTLVLDLCHGNFKTSSIPAEYYSLIKEKGAGPSLWSSRFYHGGSHGFSS